MWAGTYYNFWDYWELGHKVTFDGPNRLILINEGETSIDMQTEVYSDWKEWVVLEDNLKYYPPLNTVGGEPTVGVERLDVTYFLINGWKFKPYAGSYDFQIVGNVFDVDGGSIKVPADINPLFPNNISISTNTSVIVRQLTNTVTGSSGGSSGSFDPDQIVSASLFGAQLDALLNPPNVSASFDPTTIVSASLFGAQETSLYNIEGRVISIENILSNPFTASLVPAQSQSLNNIEILAQSQSIEIQTLNNINVTQSLQLTSLVETNVTQSLQLTSLVQANVSQSSQLINLTQTNISQSQQLNNLESQLIDVLTVLNTVSTGSLVSDDRIREVWELHGLDVTKPLNVTRTGRTFGSVTQTILTVGTGSSQDTTITRI